VYPAYRGPKHLPALRFPKFPNFSAWLSRY
jgi:hypothetical protein